MKYEKHIIILKLFKLEKSNKFEIIVLGPKLIINIRMVIVLMYFFTNLSFTKLNST